MPIRLREHLESNRSAGEAVRQKVSILLRERARINGHLRENTQALRDAVAAARLFDVDVHVPPEFLTDEPGVEITPVQPSLFSPSGDITIREAVLDQLKMAGEKGAKASRLRRVIENIVGRQLHSKTIGMTLYRLSERGQAHREGYVWFFGPAGPKKQNPGVVSAGAKSGAQTDG